MSIERIIGKRIHDLGGGFEVGRVLPFTPAAWSVHSSSSIISARSKLPPAFRVNLTCDRTRILAFPPSPIFTAGRSLIGTVSASIKTSVPARSTGWWQAAASPTANGSNMPAPMARSCMASRPGSRCLRGRGDRSRLRHRDGADLPQWREDGVQGRLIAGKSNGLKAGSPRIRRCSTNTGKWLAGRSQTFPSTSPNARPTSPPAGSRSTGRSWTPDKCWCLGTGSRAVALPRDRLDGDGAGRRAAGRAVICVELRVLVEGED